ncbi:MAG: SMC-Scp complex subunit ScpB [Ignavibacteria bacterium]|nr:SMC-Scp complex subunit ScpB [Ignavibacteria bacterium]
MSEANTTTRPLLLRVPTTVKCLVEALIFGAREPLSVRQIQALYEDQGSEGTEPRKIAYEEIEHVVEELNGEYAVSVRSYRIIQIAGGYQFATLPAYAEWLGKLYKEQSRRKLSQSSIETLAIIAYKQPITKPELESIRGVNCDYVIKTLLEKDLATIVGRAPTVGRPLLYGTSKEFLKHFGLNDLNDLPRPREIQEILGDSQFETERRMLEAQQGIEGVKTEEEFKSRLPHIPKRKAGLDDDVKITQKKRTREIKVRPSEEPEAVQPEATKEEQPVTDVPGIGSTSILEDQASIIGEPAQMEQQNVPAVEKSFIAESSALNGEIGETEQISSAELPKYIGLTQPVEGDQEIGTNPMTEGRGTDIAVQDKLESIRPIVDLPAEIPTEETMRGLQVDSETEPIPIEEQKVEISGQGEILPVGESSVEGTSTAGQIEEVDSTIDLIPQSVSPTVEEDSQGVTYSGRDATSEDAPDKQTRPQPKTRWNSWKEKIQGFIKKLFG